MGQLRTVAPELRKLRRHWYPWLSTSNILRRGAPLSLADFETIPFAEALLRGSRQHPDRNCIVVGDDRVTYGELEVQARRVGRSLIALGIERGDRVGILMANGLDFTDLLFGASLIGAIPVLYNARFKAREIRPCHGGCGYQSGSNQRHRRRTHGLR